MAENIRTTPLRLRPEEHRIILLVGDLLMALGSMLLALYTWSQYNLYRFQILYNEYLGQGIDARHARDLAGGQTVFDVPFWFYLLPIAWVLLLVELYEPHVAASGKRTTRGIAIAAFLGLIAYSLLFIIQQQSNLPRIGVGGFLLYASLLTLTWRMMFIRLYRSTGQRRRLLIVGAGKAGQTLAELYRNMGTRSFNIVGFVDDDKQKAGKAFHGVPVLGTITHLLNLIDVYHVSDIVVAINGTIEGVAFQTILDAQERGVDVTRMPILYEEMTSRVPIQHLESDWIIRSFVDGLRVSGIYELIQAFDGYFRRVIGIDYFRGVAPVPGICGLDRYWFPGLLFTRSSGQRCHPFYDL